MINVVEINLQHTIDTAEGRPSYLPPSYSSLAAAE